MAAKRALNEDAAEAMKKVKNIPDPEGSWACTFCQNINWPKRTTCNKEGCHMPRDANGVQHPEGSWACAQCNNVNWPKRTECNKCRLPRAGVKMGMGMAPQMGGGPPGTQPGSWVCPLCANVNWPARTVCNKGCGTQKPQPVASQYGQQLSQLSQMAGLNLEPYLQSLLASANPYLGSPGVQPGVSGVPGAAPVGNHPPGSWPCPTCKNVNWPKRTQCNKPGCMTLRPGFTPDNSMMSSGHPEGSWLCQICSNVNWPQRNECNKPNCGAPRPTM